MPAPSSAPFRPEALVGATLDGRYRLVSHVASGGMGAIFRAEHVHLRKDVALKVLRPDLTASPDLVERFRREAEIAATLEHENIVRVTDFGRSPEGWLFLAMEFLEGESLFERLRRDGPMRPEVAIPILVQMCRGLEAAHARGVVHRDLKPENVFLVGGEYPVAKILDFGIAKLTDPGTASETQSGMVVGTPEYLSPEQAMGTAVDARADIYTVGLIAWRMLVGRHPFQAQDARGLVLMQATRPVPSLAGARPELAGAWPGLVAAVARCCAKDPLERYASAGQLGDELQAMLPPPATPWPGTPTRTVPPVRVGTPPAAFPRLGPTPAAPTPPLPSSPGAPEVTIAIDPAAQVDLAGSPRRRWLSSAAVVLALALGLGIAVAAWLKARPVERAASLLAQGRAEEARALAERALAKHPGHLRLQLLVARANARIPGRLAAAVDAYAALQPAPLDAESCADLARALAQEKRVADRAAQMLARAGPVAVPAVLATASGSASAQARLRALEISRAMGVEARLDRVQVYGALLAEPDCDVRRAAARRLGELGNPAALPRLAELSKARREERGLFGLPHKVPVCGAQEAAAAAERIERVARP